MRGGHNRTKGTLESTMRIDIKLFQKVGLLNIKEHKKSTYHTSWNRNGKKYASMGFEYCYGNDYITACYSISDNAGVTENRRDKLYIDHIKVGYGNRAYFICSYCGEYRTTLCFYNRIFQCRVCANLNYKSSQESKWDKTDTWFNRIEKILVKLKHDKNDYEACYVPRPKRMRLYTYYRLIKQLHEVQDARNNWFVSTMRNKFGINP